MAELPKREVVSADKNQQNIQDNFLNSARKDRALVTIFLMGGAKLTGKIKSFDKYSLVLESNHQEHLIFKHAISTVVHSRPAHPAGPAAPPAPAAEA
ncbi:MAG TPA: RNA chaperone Hfq [Terriglobia bacterium]|jgi:host factor-I protein